MSQSGTLHEDLGEAGPSLDSENPEERIAARRLRIAARKEARRRYCSLAAILQLLFPVLAS